MALEPHNASGRKHPSWKCSRVNERTARTDYTHSIRRSWSTVSVMCSHADHPFQSSRFRTSAHLNSSQHHPAAHHKLVQSHRKPNKKKSIKMDFNPSLSLTYFLPSKRLHIYAVRAFQRTRQKPFCPYMQKGAHWFSQFLDPSDVNVHSSGRAAGSQMPGYSPNRHFTGISFGRLLSPQAHRFECFRSEECICMILRHWVNMRLRMEW